MADIGVFMNLKSTDPEVDRRLHILGGAGHTDHRCGGGDYSQYRSIATDLVRSNPLARVFVASCWPTLDALNWAMTQMTPPINKPIVYAGLTVSVTSPEPNGSGTGIQSFEISNLCPNWPSLLKQIAPNVKRVAVIYDQDPWRPCMHDQFEAIKRGNSSLASPFNPVREIDARSDLVSAINRFVGEDPTSPAGLIVTAGTLTAIGRGDITGTAASHNLPTIYPNCLYTDKPHCPEAAGLMSYGPDLLGSPSEPARRGLNQRAVSDFLTPILNNQPVPPPITNTDYRLIVNRETAAALSLTVPQHFTLIDGSQVTPIIVPPPPPKS